MSVEEELAAYCQSEFSNPGVGLEALPLAPEPHVDVWQGYLDAADSQGLFQVLQNNIVQFRLCH